MLNKNKNYKYLTLLIILITSVVLISSCSKKEENFDQVNPTTPSISDMPNNESAPMESDSQIPEINTDEFNPLDEEDPGIPINFGDSMNNEPEITPNDNIDFENEISDMYKASSMDDYTGEIKYAGSTPIAILPIDMPTPTPRKALEFNYSEYSANDLNLKFQAPSGWQVDESIHEAFILREPEANKKDDFCAEITISAIPLSKEYTASDLNREIKQQLEQLGARNYTRWSPSKTAKRTLLNSPGVYANFRGTLVTGQVVRGRIHMSVKNNVLYSILIVHPADYNDDFIGVFSKIRSTIDLINK